MKVHDYITADLKYVGKTSKNVV